MVSYNRYSHHARRALTHAQLLVNRYHHQSIDTGHLLVGVMLTEGSIGFAVLHDLALNAERSKPFLRTLYPTRHKASDPVVAAPALDEALALAADESAWLGHHYIGTEHLLLGMTRTNAGEASALLRAFKITAQQMRRHVLHTIKDGASEFSLETIRRNARLSELSRRVLNGAEQSALSFDHHTVGLGHLLLATLGEHRSYASILLDRCGMKTTRLQHGLETRDPVLLVSLESVLEEAWNYATRLGDHYTGTEHLLLSLTLNSAGKVALTAYDVAPDELQQRLVEHLRGNVSP